MTHVFPNFWLADEPPSEADVEAWLGGPGDEPAEPFVLFPADTPLEVLAREAGVFPSSSVARKNGLCGPVPFGVEQLGTKRKRFFTARPRRDGENEPDTLLAPSFLKEL